MSFTENFKKVCADSGLTFDEIATIYGYSRQTVFNWRQGHSPIRGRALEMVEVYTNGLLAAINKGVLPLTGGSPTERKRHIQTIKQKLYLAAVPKI